MSRESLMPIGRFARSCRLTIKALRHYDEEGLLKPARVDLVSGYRYYARSQARQAVIIGMLRSLGVGVPQVHAILQARGGERQALLEAEVARLQRTVALQQQALLAIRRLAREEDLLPYGVAVRQAAAVTVAQRTIVTAAETLIPDTTAAIYGLLDELRAAGRSPLMPVLCMSDEADAGERIVVHACVRVEPPYPELPQARLAELAGGAFAWVLHRGPYEELGLAYHALHAWAQEHGHEPRGLLREIYINDPAEVSPAELETEVWLPISLECGAPL
jgi:DNA-binding transcriptional MerR regulator